MTTYDDVYVIAYRAALGVAKTEDADIRTARDKASASAAIIASAVSRGDAPDAWFKSKKIAGLPRNAAALAAVREGVLR